MATYIVTMKLDKDDVTRVHNPGRKVTGECPVSKMCTDVTGWHHSYLERAADIEHVYALARKRGFSHITRIELIGE